MKFILYDVKQVLKNDKTYYIVSLIIEQNSSKFIKDVFVNFDKFQGLSSVEKYTDITEFCSVVLNEDNYYINININV